MKKVICLALLIIAFATLDTKASNPIKIEVYNRIALSHGKRGTIHIVIRIDRSINTEYDWVELDWFYGRSIQNVNGRHALFDRFIELPAGEHTIKATLNHMDEIRGGRFEFIAMENVEVR